MCKNLKSARSSWSHMFITITISGNLRECNLFLVINIYCNLGAFRQQELHGILLDL